MNRTFKRLFLTNWIIILSCLFLPEIVLNILPSSNYPVILALGTLIALIFSLIIWKLFLKPIQQLQKITQEMTQGDFSSRLAITRKDELGALANSLNQVSVDLQNKIMEMVQDKNELRAILASMVEGVMVIDHDERIVLFNAPIYDMLDLRSRETIGKPYWEVIRNEEINTSIKKAMTKKESLKKEIDIIAPSEGQFLMQVSAIVSEAGHLSGIVVVFHDITELKRLERLRTEFVANVSHELKTPLTLIKGFAETLRDGAIHDQEKAQRFLGIIQKHAQQLEHLVDDLLNLSALESKEAALNLQAAEIEDLIQTTVSLYKDQIQQHQQKIFIDICPGLPEVQLDQVKIGQIFANLLSNAIKFTPAGGTIRIKADKEAEFMRIDFQDSGIGIGQEHLARIFERFYRVDKGRSRELGGTGLGLAIVKHIIESHNGKVTVKSALGEGSTFSIFLPLKR